jgi:anti-sigma regulatory factor (Ser/Thr protein kinase)
LRGERLRGGHNSAARHDHGAGLRTILRGRKGGEGHEDEPELRSRHEGLFYMMRVCYKKAKSIGRE